SFRDGVHRAKLRIEIAPAAISIEGHRESALRALNANYAGIAGTGTFDRVGLHHRIVLLINPAFAADVFTGQQPPQIVGEIGFPVEFHVLWNFPRNRRLPALHGAMVNRSIVCQRSVWNFRYDRAMLPNPERVFADDFADFDRIQSPLAEHTINFLFASLLRDQQHALLRFAQHDLVGAHAGLALRHAVHFDFDSNVTARAHLAGGTSQAGGAHVLNANDSASLHGLQASFEQQLFEKWIADLDIRPFRFRLFAELFAGHGGAMNAVAAGLRADIDDRISYAGSFRIKDFIFAD